MKTMIYIAQKQTMKGAIKELDFSQLEEGMIGVKMSWKDTRNGKHEIELINVIIRDRFRRLRKYFNGLIPIYASDILIDGKSVVPDTYTEPEGDFVCDC